MRVPHTQVHTEYIHKYIIYKIPLPHYYIRYTTDQIVHRIYWLCPTDETIRGILPRRIDRAYHNCSILKTLNGYVYIIRRETGLQTFMQYIQRGNNLLYVILSIRCVIHVIHTQVIHLYNTCNKLFHICNTSVYPTHVIHE